MAEHGTADGSSVQLGGIAAPKPPEAKDTALDPVAAALAEFPVNGVRSQRDADVVAQSLLSIDGVRTARVDLQSGRVRVGFDPSLITMDTIRAAAAR
jgi:hypothetical protein